MRDEALDGPSQRLLRVFARSVPETGEGELVRLLRDAGRSPLAAAGAQT